MMLPAATRTIQSLGLAQIGAWCCPVNVLVGCARPVQQELRKQVRQALVAAFPQNVNGPELVASYVEQGLSTLLALSSEPELGLEQIEACRTLARTDARFQFIYRLPQSAGFGAAIGATLEQALFNESRDTTQHVTALLNVFMTVLDGLLDEAPEVMAGQWDELFELVCSAAAGRDPSRVHVPRHHPYAALCFNIANLWIRKLNELHAAPAESPVRKQFVSAVEKAMWAEQSSCNARFADGPLPSNEALYGRTRWPHWCQALACVIPHGWPPNLDVDLFREFVFQVADYAAYLDDICDYVADCIAARWNTITDLITRRRGLNYIETDLLQARLLVALADQDVHHVILDLGLSLRKSIEECTKALGWPACGPNALIAALTHAYLG